MARPSVISVSEIQESVETLKDLGKPVNPYQIRTLIGKGSEAKIAYFLKGLDINAEYQDQDPITKRLVSLIRPVVLELNDQYDELLINDKKSLVTKLKIEQEKVIKLEQDLLKTHDENITMHKKIETLLKSVQTITEKLAAQKIDFDKIERSNDNLKQALVLSENTLIEVRINQENSHASHNQIMTILKNEHQEAVLGYKSALEQANLSIGMHDKQVLELEKNIDRLENNAVELTVQRDNQLTQSTARESQLTNVLNDKDKKIHKLDEINRTTNEKLTIVNSEITKTKSEHKSSAAAVLKLNKELSSHKKLEKANQVLTVSFEKVNTEVEVLRSVIDKMTASSKKK